MLTGDNGACWLDCGLPRFHGCTLSWNCYSSALISGVGFYWWSTSIALVVKHFLSLHWLTINRLDFFVVFFILYATLLILAMILYRWSYSVIILEFPKKFEKSGKIKKFQIPAKKFLVTKTRKKFKIIYKKINWLFIIIYLVRLAD